MSGFLKNLLSLSLYKKSQGFRLRSARLWTLVGLCLVFLLGAFAFHRSNGTSASAIAAVVIFLVGAWVSFRTVHYPPFVDFLISVDAEMSKVSWPTWPETLLNTKVLLVFMALFTILLFVYDLIFHQILSLYYKL